MPGGATYQVRVGGQVYGPYDVASLRGMVNRNEVSPADEVSSDGVTWLPFDRHPDLVGPAAVPAGTFYYSRDGVTAGPVPVNVLQGMARSGHVRPADLVWSDGDAHSTLAGEHPALTPVFGPPAANQPYPPGAALSYQTPRFDGFEYAGFWRRVGAYIIDWICTSLIVAVGGFLIGMVIGLALTSGGASHQAITVASKLAGNVLSLVVAWLWYALFETSAARATPGKMALGIVVVDEQGRRLTFGRATGRHFGKIISGIILGIGFMMAGWTQRKQGLHDIMAGTLVVMK